jgi:DNA-binding transcriptional LysR family regulator
MALAAIRLCENRLNQPFGGLSLDYFAAMRAFVDAVDLGSFSKAAAVTGIKVSTVSRYVTALEADLGATLLNRSTRRLHLTEAGRQFHDHAARILSDLGNARLEVSSLNAHPQGVLKINLPIAFGRRHVVPHLADFLAQYPDIRLDLTLTDETVDLIASGADLAIRIGALADSTLIARRLASHHRVLVASPAYRAGHSAVCEPHDLGEHQCLPFTLRPQDTWYFRDRRETGVASVKAPVAIEVRGRVNANNSEALLDMTVAGLGIALLPTWLAGDAIASGRLDVLLPDWHATMALGPERAIWSVYPVERVVSPKVRAFTAFLESRFGDPPYWDPPYWNRLSRRAS